MAIFGAAAVTICCVILASSPAIAGTAEASDKLFFDGENLAPWSDGLTKFSPVISGLASADSSSSKYPLILAAKRTRRPDIMNKLRVYRGGWDVTNKHYWASVGFTGAAGFILASVWFLCFGLVLSSQCCCGWSIGMKRRSFTFSKRACVLLLLVFTCAASTGCILLSVGQDEFHDEVFNTIDFVVNQSDFTVQILKNVTDFLSLAKAVNVDQVNLPSNIQNEIDKLTMDLNDARNILSEKTSRNSGKIRQVFSNVRSVLIVVATVMLLLAVLGFFLSILGYKYAIYIFVASGWLLVAVTFVLCGVFIILNNSIGDTCTAMDEWVQYPQAETALSNILPCVDEQTTNLTLHRSKEVIWQLVNIVNTAVSSIANSNLRSQDRTYFYNQSGPLMPLLCSPYDSQLLNQECDPQETSLTNASVVWQNYTCMVSASGFCISPGRVTPDIYLQLVTAVNVSYALDHYTPFLLNLQNCNFVRETFNSITAHYCPHLDCDLRMVNAGLGLISISVILCLFLWIFYTHSSEADLSLNPKMVNARSNTQEEPSCSV